MLFICLMSSLAVSLAFCYWVPSVPPRLKLLPLAIKFLTLEMGVAGVGGLGSPLSVSLFEPNSACGGEK
jgi:hypothetical protein